MNQQIQAIKSEFIKNRHTRIRWVTFIAFGLAPIFGSIFMLLMKDGGYEGLPGSFRTKAIMFSFEANWKSFLGLLSQAVGIGGVVIFGFVASWLFGREYSDKTAKDLLALPISRGKILNAKFIYYLIWCTALAFFILILGLAIGFSIHLKGYSNPVFFNGLETYFTTTLLVILLNTPIAFFAIWGKGYLTPLGVVVLLLVLAQIMGALGMGTYFPWSVPAIYSGSAGEEMKLLLNEMSFIILIGTGFAGYTATLLWWKYADQH